MKHLILILLCTTLIDTTAFNQRKKKEANKAVTVEETVQPAKIKLQNEKPNITIAINQYIPYCGGAYPAEDQLNNNQPISNTEFVLIDLADSSKTIVKTNALGVIELYLKPGNYAVQESFKNCSFQEFQTRNAITISGEYYQIGDDECYLNWWKSFLGTFTILEPQQELFLNLAIGSACFTGTNPCLYYNGPYPP